MDVIYRNNSFIGYKERTSYDGLQYTVGVLNKPGDEYLFTETISITGSAIVVLFRDRNSEKTLAYLKERALAKSKARFDSGNYEANGRYVQQINSESLEREESIDEQYINLQILETLHNIRKWNPSGYKSDRLEIEGFCELYQVRKEVVFYLFSILEEKNYISITEMESGKTYITMEGIVYLDSTKKLTKVESEPERIAPPKIWDVFISHASEDKQEIVEPLAMELKKYGINVWYDKWSLRVGDSLRKKIDEGLALSKYGVVVLSPAFFSKQWTSLELGGLLQREVTNIGEKVVLPIWHNLTPREVTEFSPILSDKLAINTNQGISVIAKQLAEVILETDIEEKTSGKDLTYLSLDISFNKLNAESDGQVHKYNFLINASLKCPPVLKTFRLCLLWPNNVTITKIVNFRKGIEQKVNNQYFTELWYDQNNPFFPGETKEIIGQNSSYQIQYIFNNDVWDWIRINDIKLRYIIYFENSMPEEGIKYFNELHMF